MGNQTKDDELYREMCRVVGKVVLEMRDLGQEPKHIVIAGVLRTTLANQRVKRSELGKVRIRALLQIVGGDKLIIPFC
ncbi:fumarate hydratase FumD [Enterobacter cloacae]|nr:fumarate hydratase FumD [Enterobacter cloacae]RWT22330.1 fumarate hydratase FumD [Enterobacter cloacae]